MKAVMKGATVEPFVSSLIFFCVHSFIHLLFVFNSVTLTPSSSSFFPLLPVFFFVFLKKESKKDIFLIQCQENQRQKSEKSVSLPSLIAGGGRILLSQCQVKKKKKDVFDTQTLEQM